MMIERESEEARKKRMFSEIMIGFIAGLIVSPLFFLFLL
jgi:hypothetical protein